MCNKAIEEDPWFLANVPDHFKTPEMFERAFEKNSYTLEFIPNHLKTEEICEIAVVDDLWTLRFASDQYVTQELIKTWHDDDDYCIDDNELFKWYDGYEKRKAQKARIEKELMPVAWHLSRWLDWCVPEDEKEETEKLWRQTI